MKIYRTTTAIFIENEGIVYDSPYYDWDTLVNRDELYEFLQVTIQNKYPVGVSDILSQHTILPPIGTQEVWAAGVTYIRSKVARMEESKDSGGGTFYDKVYEADRPEIFFKATSYRVTGPNEKVRIRKDSVWNVPEPELTLFINSNGKIVGYTIGNDMSSRSIEGENPLYLPQAKVYDGCAGLGPCLYVPQKPLSSDTAIQMEIKRDKHPVFYGKITLDQMKRQHTELVDYLYRECSFPQGCYLMTGTGIVPPNEFTLHSGDEILISISPIGLLTTIVE
ncbi:fumarylacetoacetate hydrolase family protein [Cytophagaceae bacterium YF14B1]|uniref:Fumarylacetoacetate hydrolase family protein n=1 Tax=Xanthocytophaga flava TaxID=3048013 RepID=A0AAE3QN47_9BACT|nr:fumarylacetoacetate hydrolase family protein [Xanthocytophaga flavus]MDJ1482407.1 fumarylacetoacetate hydrolase family protein [Xanthocytophaga flavus]